MAPTVLSGHPLGHGAMGDLARAIKRRINDFNRKVASDEGLRNDLAALGRPIRVQIEVPDAAFSAYCRIEKDGIHGFEEQLRYDAHDILMVTDRLTLMELLEGKLPYDLAKERLKVELFLREEERPPIRLTLKRILERDSAPAPKS